MTHDTHTSANCCYLIKISGCVGRDIKVCAATWTNCGQSTVALQYTSMVDKSKAPSGGGQKRYIWTTQIKSSQRSHKICGPFFKTLKHNLCISVWGDGSDPFLIYMVLYLCLHVTLSGIVLCVSCIHRHVYLFWLMCFQREWLGGFDFLFLLSSVCKCMHLVQ